MPTSVHQLDDGAWLSVNDSREVNVSDLWWLARHDFCGCEMADWLALGRVVEPRSGGFYAVDPTSVHVPGRRTRLARPADD